MKKLIDFLENYSVEKNFYTVIYDIYGRQEWEVYWNKYKTNSLWGLKKTRDDSWAYYKQAEFLKCVSLHKLNVCQLEHELLNSIKTMVAYTFMVQEEASKQFGEQFLSDTQQEFTDFARSLIEAIHNIMPPSQQTASKSDKKPALQVVRQ